METTEVKKRIAWNKGKKGVQTAWNKGKKNPEMSLRQTGNKNPMFGKPCWSKGTKGLLKSNLGSFKKGIAPWNIGTKGIMKPWNKGKKFPQFSGEKCHLWKGGITPENHKIRTSLEMKLFKKACLERDDFTCQKTGERGGKLVIHHINNFADFPELRTSISNGITLSQKAHKEFHKKYGNRNNTKEQLLEFLNNK